MSSTIDRLERRMTSMEQQIRATRRAADRYRRAAVGLGLGLVAVTMLAADGDPALPEVIQARRFEVVDHAGHVVVALAAGELGGEVNVWSNEHFNVARLWVNASGGDLALWNKDGTNVIGAYATPEGCAR